MSLAKLEPVFSRYFKPTETQDVFATRSKDSITGVNILSPEFAD